ncbi:MAG: hypothetical protein M0P61_03670 [Ignavibacteriaceae bacterium]|jgi:hypothetical protein|nr:hypothetical protein [Ignavibacteriaceae bacterium]
MLKPFFVIVSVATLLTINSFALGKDSEKNTSANLSQFYSGKFGFYSPSNGLNNGLLIGVDGITEFNKYNFFLSGDIDLYQKKTFDIFEEPKPNISDQLMLLLPLHINFGYQLAQIPDADTRIYAGIGAGYYLYFYSVTYQKSSGGLFPSLTSSSDQKNGGNFFFSIFGRILIGKIFVEPRYYFATHSEGNVDGNKFLVNPTGFAITLGFQY